MSIPKIHRHFQHIDPIMYAVIKTFSFEVLQKNNDASSYFSKLCGAIIGQQLSGKVADVIEARFVTLLKKKVTPARVLKIPDEKLRGIGLSWAKVKYVKDLATKVASGEVDLESMPQLDDETVVVELTKVKGIGRWTAEMFLLFTLGREDIFSFGDLGLKKGFQKLYGAEISLKEMTTIIESWSPYRSYGSDRKSVV